MAEKSGMNIKADATIVDAAGNLAEAMKPFDMSEMAEGLVESHKDLMDSMAESFKSVLKKIDIADSGLQEVLKVMRKKMNSGDLTPKEREELQVKMEDYRARWKDIPWGKKGKQQRNDLLYEINREIKTTKDREAAALDVLSTLESGTYDAEQLSPEELEFYEQIVRSESEQETSEFFSKKKNEDGEWVYNYTYKEEVPDDTEAGSHWKDTKMSGTIYDIQEKLNNTKKDYAKIGEVNEVVYGYEKYAKDNPNAKFEDIYNRIWSGIEGSFNQDEAKFRSAINHNIGWNDKSYVETLRDVNSAEFQNIVTILTDMNDLEFDFNDDGKVDQADFKGDYVTKENINEMIRVLTKPEPGEKRIAYEAAAKFYADTEARKAFGFGVDNRPKDGGGDGKTTTTSGFTKENVLWNGQQVPITADEKLGRRNQIKNRDTVEGKFGTYKWNEETQMYTEYNLDGEEVGEMTPYQVAQREKAVRSNETRSHDDFKTTVDAGADDKEVEITGGAEWKLINVDNDNTAAANLNDHFVGTDFSKQYKFVPQYGWSDWPFTDNPLTDDIMLIDVTTGKPARDSDGNSYRFGTGMLGVEAAQKIIDEINSTDILAPFIEQKRRILLDAQADPNNPN